VELAKPDRISSRQLRPKHLREQLRINRAQIERVLRVTPNSPVDKTVAVFVDHRDTFYLNGQPVARQLLELTVKQALSRNVSQIVYYEADDNSEYEQDIYAMDCIKGAGGQVFWIATATRSEWNKRAQR
jgi:biopolymer transport protein ExbD